MGEETTSIFVQVFRWECFGWFLTWLERIRVFLKPATSSGRFVNSVEKMRRVVSRLTARCRCNNGGQFKSFFLNFGGRVESQCRTGPLATTASREPLPHVFRTERVGRILGCQLIRARSETPTAGPQLAAIRQPQTESVSQSNHGSFRWRT